MEKQITIIMLVIAFGGFAYSANAQTELIYNGGVYQNEIRLTAKTVKELMKNDTVALSKYKSGRIQYIIGKGVFYLSVIPAGLGSGLLIADVIGTYDGSLKEFGGVLWLGGVVGMLFGLSIDEGGERKMKRAVRIYNRNINKNKVSVNFGLTGNGVGLNVNF